MATYTEKLEGLYQQMRLDIINKVREIGKDSKVGFKTIKINGSPDKYFLDGSYLVEVGEDYVFDYFGQSYNFSALDYDDLCELVDYINTLK